MRPAAYPDAQVIFYLLLFPTLNSKSQCLNQAAASACPGAQVIFYLPLFLTSLGSSTHASLEDALIVGGVNVASTLLALYLVDRIGRRPMLIAGEHMLQNFAEAWPARTRPWSMLSSWVASMWPARCLHCTWWTASDGGPC